MNMRLVLTALSGLALVAAPVLEAPALAGWRVVPAGTPATVAKSPMRATPAVAWNRQTSRAAGKNVETWTLDGALLNEVAFFGGVADGDPLFKERQKKDKPLPRFKASMLPTDIVTLFEASNRIVLESSLFAIDKVEPATLGGHKGVRFEYHYSMQGDQLNRRGEAVGAIVGGKLYLVSFVAPEIHYFDRDVAQFRKIVETVAI